MSCDEPEAMRSSTRSSDEVWCWIDDVAIVISIVSPIEYAMATTIQVDEATLEELRRLKAKLHADSYDAVVRTLLMTHKKRTTPILGLSRGIGPFVRDHHDRD